jgi:hypothetical protein
VRARTEAQAAVEGATSTGDEPAPQRQEDETEQRDDDERRQHIQDEEQAHDWCLPAGLEVCTVG